jgi:hypothetical protein
MMTNTINTEWLTCWLIMVVGNLCPQFFLSGFVINSISFSLYAQIIVGQENVIAELVDSVIEQAKNFILLYQLRYDTDNHVLKLNFS